jgi:hypothetical protein
MLLQKPVTASHPHRRRPPEHRVQQLKIHFNGPSADRFRCSLDRADNSTGQALLRKSDLVLFGECSDVAILAEEREQYLGASFCVRACSRGVIEERDTVPLVSLPKIAQRENSGTLRLFVPKQSGEQLSPQSFCFRAVLRLE